MPKPPSVVVVALVVVDVELLGLLGFSLVGSLVRPVFGSVVRLLV